ncbi:uncharacterized protein LOC133292114 [Gastrolobium bilobum]|uniref:uncharacterized protein LOC133292114 n=1 Tax=Gastrolobium bilobum TaxID=150636 RepID=UPI002AB2DB34|nr:uncharacterized protein LOC133292114 [Gastrolobium bilobum]
MDAFDFSNEKSEKGSAMRRYNLFTGIAKKLRILELCLALFLLSWILTRLPFALRVSADYLRKISPFLGSPLFVFAICNAIIAALIAQSGLFTAAGDGDIKDYGSSTSEAPSPVAVAEKVEYQDRLTCTDNDSGAVKDSDLRKVYRRSQSEKLKGNGADGNKTAERKLRRSETEKVRENLYPQDKLSNEEFKRTIEAFIAKQMRSLREESLAIVVHTSETNNNQT